MNFTKFYLFLGLFFAAFFSSIAQSGFNYQSLIKDANGAVLTNAQISLKFSILYDSSSGTPVYVETHGLTTPANGVVNLVIGSGTATTGSFSNIDWSKASIYLKREVEIANSGTYTDFGTALLYNVPKANYSSSTQGISYNSSTVSITNLNVTNTITATAFVGDGSGLTGINASVSSSTHLDSNNTISIGGVVSATNSVAIGKDVLVNNTSGNDITAVGYRALFQNTTGIENSGFGTIALYSNTSGNYNTAVGKWGLFLNTTGNYNTALGYATLGAYSGVHTGDQNTAIGSRSMLYNTSGSENTAVGFESLQTNIGGKGTVAIGYKSMFYANNSPSSFITYNTAIGYEALRGSSTSSNNVGTNNTAVGYQSLLNNVFGYGNTAIGSSSLKSNLGGSFNTAIGHESLITNTYGATNVAIGPTSMGANTTGNGNTAIGKQSLFSNTEGSFNIAIGYETLIGNLTGTANTALGNSAGNTNTAGSSNTLIGSNADVGSNNLTNATAIGANATVTTSNTIQLGDLNVGYVKHYGTLSASSDRRLKENIVKTPYGLAEVLKLNPVNYRFISNGLNQIGFIAQEVQPLLPEVVTGTEGDIEKGETLGITYSSLIPVLTKAIQEQQQQLEAQQKQIQSLIKRLEAIENK